MQTSLEQSGKGQIKLRVEVQPDELKSDIREAVVRLSTSGKFPGFRPGKAPYDVVAKAIGELAIWQAAAERVVARTFAAAVKERELQTLGSPEVSMEKLAPGNPLVYTATVAILPDVTLGQLGPLPVTKQARPVNEEDLAKAIDDLRKMLATEKPVDRPAKLGDRVEIDVDVSVDGVVIEGGKSRKHPAVLGEATFIPGFEEQVVGLTKGQTKSFSLAFPQDYHAKPIAGKSAQFVVTVQSVAEVILPDVDDAFAKRLAGLETVGALRDQLRKNLEAERQEESERKYEAGLLDELTKRTTFGALPEVLLENEKDRMLSELRHDIEHRGMKFADYLSSLKQDENSLRKELTVSAERRVKTALVIRSIAQRESVSVDSPELEKELAKIRAESPADPDRLRRIDSDDFRDYVRSVIINRKAVAALKAKQVAAP